MHRCASGVSQRDVTQHYPALADEADELEELVLEFFEEHIQNKFSDPDCKLSFIAYHCCKCASVMHALRIMQKMLCTVSGKT